MSEIDLLKFIETSNIEYYKNRSIKPFLTIGIGGKVKGIFIVKNKKDLKDLVEILYGEQLKFILIGGGSNILFSDYAPHLYVIINKTSSIEYINNELHVSSGLSNKKVLEWCKINGFCGLEFLAGIPGTIGGAAAVNAGAFGQSMADVLSGAEVYFSKSGVKNIGKDKFNFEYRNSVFKYGTDIILSLKLKVKKCSVEKISDCISQILKQRGKKHPVSKTKTAGCFFKNPIIKRFLDTDKI